MCQAGHSDSTTVFMYFLKEYRIGENVKREMFLYIQSINQYNIIYSQNYA